LLLARGRGAESGKLLGSGLLPIFDLGEEAYMEESNLRTLDLNLLVLLRALLDKRHVSRAAQEVGISQSGMSHALSRLRKDFRDPLLVQGEGGYVLTPRAKEIETQLRQVLFDIQGIYAPRNFNPAEAQGEVRIASLDYEFMLLLPAIIARINSVAPNLKIKAVFFDEKDFGPLIRGEIDLVLSAVSTSPANIYRQKLFSDENICLVSAQYFNFNQELTVKRFIQARHIWINVDSSDAGNIDHTLAEKGLYRTITATAPSFFLAAHAVSESDLIAVLPRRIGMRLMTVLPLVIMDSPVRFPIFDIHQMWHERYHSNPQHLWLRNLICDIAKAVK
jgi:DNA-binding transcriptional LysR family regulator